MPWWKVDDALHSHPKWLATPPRARALWVTAGSWCASHLTDGRVPSNVVTSLGGRASDARALVKSGLWETEGDGYRFHGFAKYQPTKAEVEAVRAAARERSRAARARQVRANVADASRAPTHPDPTYIGNSSSSPKESAPETAEEEALRAEARRRLAARDATSGEVLVDPERWLAACVARLRAEGWTPPPPAVPDATEWLAAQRAITPSPPPPDLRAGLKRPEGDP